MSGLLKRVRVKPITFVLAHVLKSQSVRLFCLQYRSETN